MPKHYQPMPQRVTAMQWQPGVEHDRVLRIDHGSSPCRLCGQPYNRHGVIESREATRMVCPGDYVLDLGDGGFEAMSPEEFASRFVEVADETP